MISSEKKASFARVRVTENARDRLIGWQLTSHVIVVENRWSAVGITDVFLFFFSLSPRGVCGRRVESLWMASRRGEIGRDTPVGSRSPGSRSSHLRLLFIRAALAATSCKHELTLKLG